MQVINKFTMTLPARSANESFARACISAFAAQLDPTLEEINDIKTAVSEAVTNCIVHAYKEQVLGKIYITAFIYDNNSVKIKIRAKGCGIANVEQAMEPLYTSVGGERAGLGFAVMESFMDGIKVSSAIGKGTTVTLTKKISPRISLNG